MNDNDEKYQNALRHCETEAMHALYNMSQVTHSYNSICTFSKVKIIKNVNPNFISKKIKELSKTTKYF